MADFKIREGRQFGFDCSVDGQLVVAHGISPGPADSGWLRADQAQRSYSHRDGVTLRDRL